MKTTQKQAAKDLFFSTSLSRKQIAETTAIHEKTLYLWIKKEAWDEHKKAAHAAPAIIVDNLCYMLVELQNHIAERPVGLRFPTAQEADTMRKIINSISKIKEYTSVGANMQMMVDFTNYIGADEQFCTRLQAYAESYFTARKANPRYNNNFGFAAEQSPAATEAELNEIRENILADINATPQTYEEYLVENQTPQTPITAESTPLSSEITGLNFTGQSGISTGETAETLIKKAFQAPKPTHIFFPASVKTGNFVKPPAILKRPTFLTRAKKTTHSNTNTQPSSVAA